MRPDLLQHLIKQARLLVTDLGNGLGRVDIQALAAEWAVTGVDLSYWQGAVDFDRLALAADFALIRAGYGNDYIDPRMAEYVSGCAGHGIPWGLYWYVKPGKDWRKHADNFWDFYRSSGGQLYPVFDLEESGGLAKSALESWLKKMYDRFCELSGRNYNQVMTYTSAGFLNRALPLTNWLKHIHLWAAHWTTADQPTLPHEWAVPGETWKLWQWSATGKGSDYGVSSKYVDLDRYNGSRVQFAADFGVSLPEPEPPAEPDEWTVVNCTWLNGRSAPDPSVDNRVVSVRAGQRVTNLHEQSGDWLKCGLGPVTCWMHGDYLE